MATIKFKCPWCGLEAEYHLFDDQVPEGSIGFQAIWNEFLCPNCKLWFRRGLIVLCDQTK